MATSTDEARVQRKATYQDVLDAPAHKVAEIIKGRFGWSIRSLA